MIKICSGRCWIPPEWRDPLGMRFFQRTAVIAVTGARGKHDARELLAAHLPLLAETDDSGSADMETIPDHAGARRMARRLSRLRAAAGVRELTSAGLVPRHVPAVYAWRAAWHGEHVFHVSPDGTFTPVAVFRAMAVQDRAGHWDSRIVASRPW